MSLFNDKVRLDLPMFQEIVSPLGPLNRAIHSNYRNEDSAVTFMEDILDVVSTGWTMPLRLQDLFWMQKTAMSCVIDVMESLQEVPLDSMEDRFPIESPFGGNQWESRSDPYDDGKGFSMVIYVEKNDDGVCFETGTVTWEWDKEYQTPTNKEYPGFHDRYPLFLSLDAALDEEALEENKRRLREYEKRFSWVTDDEQRNAIFETAFREASGKTWEDEVDTRLTTMQGA